MSVENPGQFAIGLAASLEEVGGHVASVKSELEEVQGDHNALYDGASDTGDQTRAKIQEALDDLERIAGDLNQAGTDIREYGERVIAAGGS